MERFTVSESVYATPMTRQAYNDLRQWSLPADENGDDAGYLIERRDKGIEPNHHAFEGHISWMPDVLFHRVYRDKALDFGGAINALKRGKRVSREGWNGKGMFLFLVPASSNPVRCDPNGVALGVSENLVPCAAYIAMKTAQNTVVPWLASQTDVLAEDWMIEGDTNA